MPRFLLLLIILLSFPPTVLGQLPLSTPETKTEPTLPEAVAPLEDLDVERNQVDAHLQEAKPRLEDATQALAAAAQAGQTGEARIPLKERVNMLQGRVQVANKHLKLIEDEKTLRAERDELEQKSANWVGFSSPPPYPASLADQLFRTLKSKQAARKTIETRLATLDYGKSLVADAYAEAQRAMRQSLEAIESATSDLERQQARSQHTRNELAVTYSGENFAYVRALEQHLNDRVALYHLEEEFITRKLADAVTGLEITEQEAEKRHVQLEDQLANASTRQVRATEQRDEIAAQVESLQSRMKKMQATQPDTAQDTAGPPENEVTRLQRELELRKQQLDITRQMLTDIDLQISYLQVRRELWQHRLQLEQDWSLTKAKSTLKSTQSLNGFIAESINSLEHARAELDDFALPAAFDDPQLNVVRQALQETVADRGEQLQRSLRAARRLRDFFDLWHMEIQADIGSMSTSEQLRGWSDIAAQQAHSLWNYELMSVEDTLVVDGERIVEQRPITVGKVLEALMILAVGLFLASAGSKLISRIVLPYSRGPWQDRLLLQRVLRIGLILLVVVLALVTVKIPLTVFAFLGGAIAIGIGFGAQNLINNFISGFILLGEKPIRAGDQIEIEGTLGIVEKIGDRCTRVRRFDGVEILIPNSALLENSVTNMTLSDRHIRTNISVGIAYGSPTRAIHALLLEIAGSHSLVVEHPEPAVIFEDFADSTLVFTVYVWLDLAAQPDYRAVITELRHTIAERFEEHGYTMAFPQRDVHLHSPDPIRVQMQERPV